MCPEYRVILIFTTLEGRSSPIRRGRNRFKEVTWLAEALRTGSAQNRQWQGWKIWIHVAPTRKLPLVTTVRQRVLFWYLPQSFPTTFALVTQKLGVQGLLVTTPFRFLIPACQSPVLRIRGAIRTGKGLMFTRHPAKRGRLVYPVYVTVSPCYVFTAVFQHEGYMYVLIQECVWTGPWSVYFYPSLLFPYYLTGSYFVCFGGIYSIFYSIFITKLSTLSH